MRWGHPGDRNQALAVALSIAALLLGLLLVASADSASAVITVRWLDAGHVEICTTQPGRLYAAGATGDIAELDIGCRPYPQPGLLVDANWGPAEGRVYFLVTADGTAHIADPLPRYWPWRLWLPVIAR